MAEPQAEPFFVVLSHLRTQLHLGELAPGARIAAVELGDRLRLSTTPVREALSRLAGEGLLEDRRGQGFFVRLLNAADIADLHRLSLAALMIALEPRRALRLADVPLAPPASEGTDPVAAVEELFRRWVAAAGSRMLVHDFRILQARLGPVRRLEPPLLPDLAAEAAGLAGAATRAERLVRLRAFHGARIRLAERLAARLEARAAGRGK